MARKLNIRKHTGNVYWHFWKPDDWYRFGCGASIHRERSAQGSRDFGRTRGVCFTVWFGPFIASVSYSRELVAA